MPTNIDITLPITEQPAYLRIADAAALLRRSVRTIAHWEQRGLLRVLRPAGGAPLISRTEIERLLGECGR
jgi:predicted site-specific integrase-resolvase